MSRAPHASLPEDTLVVPCPACVACRSNAKRGFPHNWSRGRCRQIHCESAWTWEKAGAVDSGLCDATRLWSTLSGWAWPGSTDDDVETFPASRCDDRSRGRIALPDAGCGDCRNLWQSPSSELHRDEAVGLTRRGIRGALLADPAKGHRRPQRSTCSVARKCSAFNTQPGRCLCAGRSALADQLVSVTRRTAGRMGSAP